ncbi:MAG TPA: DUF4276 family protein [Thermoanaerobaculia bacterium]|jgi:hypothetical protein|nr:DUF4276 family protein [Thermoanaerobaculia bacterium]HQN06606.1 DUF4276 family protein [Thermoanaerobaculia bacterium]HQP84872.1 DUF4276 family protein [Thermoanaerobaculia bacterium]
MKPIYIAPIVEGHGEKEAVPALLYRLASAAGIERSVRVNHPIRVKAGSFLHDGAYLKRHATLAAEKAAQAGGLVLVFLDCDDGCPATLGPDLLRRVRAVRSDVEWLIVLAQREYESWFLAAARSLRDRHGLPSDLDRPPQHESIRDAKGWLGDRMAGGYDPLTHQFAFTKHFDLDEAAGNRSFRRFRDRIGTVLVSRTETC